MPLHQDAPTTDRHPPWRAEPFADIAALEADVAAYYAKDLGRAVALVSDADGLGNPGIYVLAQVAPSPVWVPLDASERSAKNAGDIAALDLRVDALEPAVAQLELDVAANASALATADAQLQQIRTAPRDMPLANAEGWDWYRTNRSRRTTIPNQPLDVNWTEVTSGPRTTLTVRLQDKVGQAITVDALFRATAVDAYASVLAAPVPSAGTGAIQTIAIPFVGPIVGPGQWLVEFTSGGSGGGSGYQVFRAQLS